MSIGRKYHLGWWPQNGALDSFDAKLSLPIMKLDAGLLGEYLISIPGTWFGMPPMVWGSITLLVAGVSALSDPQVTSQSCKYYFGLLLLPSFALSLGAYLKIARDGEIKRIYIWTKYILLPFPFGIPLLAELLLGERAGHAAALALSSWFFTETVCHVFKISARRMRPVIALADKIKGVTRRLSSIQHVLTEGETAFESFPSGDAAGAAAISTVLAAYGAGPLSWLCVALSAFGRVYLHAHHVIDVVVGSLFGYACTRGLINYYGLDSGLGPFHSVGFMGLFVGFHVFCRKYLTFNIPAEFRVGKSTYNVKHMPSTAEVAADGATPSISGGTSAPYFPSDVPKKPSASSMKSQKAE
mmetsp:Transcript_6443/g.13082  ORF Transcript_6443/g.13082 Transcript_6443/m.13082 type:complete len:356 (+) Transcript_6443:229-1296(+)|eukprot:CAMPEP_0171492422 /NCGR_PEP_ID=MMETSP0958-20121227/4401_1 /TAXON_ID=87120 /ORGANISM="Aurantiochytrium limacinum, Strain ATCCMYA-1381" /LENGTH=355 /DNA_ID=CAMNT_0012025939 /DNA_START=213 /DNA_END=1280 /DNA_ORIENTATION=+